MLKLIKNRIFVGAMCLLAAGMLAFVLLPKLYSSQSSTVKIVKINQTVESGTVITADMLTVTEVGSYGLPSNVVKVTSNVIGLVAGDTIYAGEYLWSNRFMTKEAYEEATSKVSLNLSEGTYLLTISLPTQSSGIAGILRADDIVDVYGYTDDNDTIAVNEELTAITVYEVLNSKLVSLDDLDAKLEATPDADTSNYDFAPAYVVFTVNEQQAKTLIGLEKNKSLHLTLRKAGA